MKKLLKITVALLFSLCLTVGTLAAVAAAPVSKVQNLKATATPTSVTVSWDKLSGASGYQIQRYSKKWKTVKTVSSSVKSYKATKLSPKKTYKFRVRAYVLNGKKKTYGPYTTVSAKTVTQKVKELTVKPALTTASVSWSKVSGSTGYQVKYSTSKKFSSKTTKTVTVKKQSSVKTTIKSLKPAKNYYVRVRAYTTVKGKKYYGSYSPTVAIKTAVPALSSLSVKSTTRNSASLSWKAVSGATGYDIEKYVSGKWSSVRSGNKSTSYTVSSLPAGTAVQLRVRARQTVKGTTYRGAWKTVTATTKIDSAKNLTYKNLKASSVNLYWTAAKGATSYQILNNGKAIKTVTTNSCTLSLSAGTKYTLTVVSCKGSERGPVSNAVTFITAPSAVAGLKSSTVADRKLTYTWSKVTGALGYEIEFGSGSSWTKAVISANSYTAINLKPGTSYKIRVRAYNKNGSALQYSGWSSYVGVTTTGIVSAVSDETSAKLGWMPIAKAAKYLVQYYNTETGVWGTVETVTSPSVSVDEHTENKIGLYRVAAYDSANKWLYTSEGVTVSVPGYSVVQDKHKVTVSWPAYYDAVGYQVIRYTQKNCETIDSLNSATTSVSHYLAPGLVYTYEIYAYTSTGEKTVARFGVTAGTLEAADNSDAGKHSQLLYLVEAINRSKVDDSHNTKVKVDSTKTNVINTLHFGFKGLNSIEAGSFNLILKIAFGSKIKGDHVIEGGYIRCNDTVAVDSLCTVLNDGETDPKKMLYQTEVTKENYTVEFNKGSLVGEDEKGESWALYNLFGPSGEKYMAELYDDSLNGWKNGISSVNCVKTANGYKITTVIKQEVAPNFHSGLAPSAGAVQNNGMQVISSKVGATTLTVETDKECRLLSYEVDSPYLAEVTVVDSMTTDEEELTVDLGMNIVRTTKQKVTFTRTK